MRKAEACAKQPRYQEMFPKGCTVRCQIEQRCRAVRIESERLTSIGRFDGTALSRLLEMFALPRKRTEVEV